MLHIVEVQALDFDSDYFFFSFVSCANARFTFSTILHVGCVRGKPEIQEAASWYMEACIGGVRNAAVNLALLLRKGSIQSLQSLDGTEQFSLSDISIWLEKCVKKMNMSVSSRQEIDILIAQLVGDNVRIENRYRLEFETTGGQLQSFNNSRNSSSRHPNYSGNNTLEDEISGDTDRYRGREEERGYSDDRRLKDTEIEREREWAWEMEKERERERQFGPRIMH